MKKNSTSRQDSATTIDNGTRGAEDGPQFFKKPLISAYWQQKARWDVGAEIA
jgi:hypothetical protein